MKKTVKYSFIPILITLFIVTILIISGPAKAFDLSLDIDEDSVEKGERVTFTSTIEITGNDSNLPISEITLIIDGPTYKTCKFDVEGNKLSSCEGVLEINLIENTTLYEHGNGYGYFFNNRYGFGYGYGFNEGKLTYEIILDTDSYDEGDYETELKVKMFNNTFSIPGPDFEITEDLFDDSFILDELEIQDEFDIIEIDKILKIEEGETYNFLHGTDKHKLIVNEINENADLTIFSQEQNIQMNLGETKETDLNSDNKDDMKIRLLFVSEDKTKAVLLITQLNKDIVFEKAVTVSYEDKGPIKLENKEKNASKKSSAALENISFQLTHFSFLWLLILLNLIMIEMVGIVGAKRR